MNISDRNLTLPDIETVDHFQTVDHFEIDCLSLPKLISSLQMHAKVEYVPLNYTIIQI